MNPFAEKYDAVRNTILLLAGLYFAFKGAAIGMSLICLAVPSSGQKQSTNQ